MILRLRSVVQILGYTAALHFLDLLESRQIDAFRIVYPARGVGAGHYLRAHLLRLLDGVDGNVAGAGNRDGLAGDVDAVALEHFLRDVEKAVSGSLRSRQGAAVGQSLSGKHALVYVADPLILSEQIADLSGSRSDISGGNVRIRPDMSVQLGHEALAEGHHFPVGFSLGIEIRAALAASDGKSGQGVLEHLLKAKELDDAEIHGRMQAQASLVGSDGAVELYAVAGVHLNLSLIVHPRYAEDHLALRIYQPFQQRFLSVGLLICLDHDSEGLQNLLYSLMEFRLRGVFLNDLSDNLIYVRHSFFPPFSAV